MDSAALRLFFHRLFRRRLVLKKMSRSGVRPSKPGERIKSGAVGSVPITSKFPNEPRPISRAARKCGTSSGFIPMTAHIALHKRHPMEQRHFDHWLAHWNATLDALFTGAKAQEAKARAASIAPVMMWKVRNS